MALPGGSGRLVRCASLPSCPDCQPFGTSVPKPGPATGLPARTEQGDLELVLYAGHGEFPRIIFAPGTRDEALHLTQQAFNLADKYQVPVFVLTDPTELVMVSGIGQAAKIPHYVRAHVFNGLHGRARFWGRSGLRQRTRKFSICATTGSRPRTQSN